MMAAPVAICVLLAAGFDWLEALLPVAFVLFWIISQIIAVIRRVQGGNGAGNGRRPQPLPRVEPPRAPARPAGEEAADWRGELERQIAEFLRESQGRPAEQPRDRSSQRPADGGQRRPDTAVPGRSRQKTRSSRPVTNTSAAERQKQRPTVRPASAPAAATATTGAGVEPAAKGDVARHVQEAFPRPLSHLEGGLVHDAPPMIGDPATAPAAPPADDLVKMLRNPATIRQVILMREVLDRPVDRW